MLQKYFIFMIWLMGSLGPRTSLASPLEPPPLDADNARILLEISLFPDDLVWTDWLFPLTLGPDAPVREREALEALAVAGILQREPLMVRQNGPEGDVHLQGGWLYRIDPRQPALRQDDGEWLLYGRGRVLGVPQISAPVWKDPYWYVEAELAWCVEQPARWLALAGVRALYQARRSLESCQRPFHRSVYFQYDGRHWGYWQMEPATDR